MWQKLQTALLLAFMTALTLGGFPLVIWTIFTTLWGWYGWTLFDNAVQFTAPIWTPLASITTTANFASFLGALELANAWVPLGEGMVAIVAVWGLRAVVASVKIVLRLWELAPMKFS